MNKNEYLDEIDLIREQNDTEFELYPLVAEIIAPTLEGLSKRYVFARRLSELGQIYFGIRSFPDIAVLDKDFNNRKNKDITIENRRKLKGCVEVKAYGKELYTLDGLKDEFFGDNPGKEAFQLISEVLWYKKVLYTNGAEWKLFEFDEQKDHEETIIKIAKDRIKSEDKEFVWYKNDEVKKMIRENITERIITDDCAEDWDGFIAEIEKLRWQ